MDKNGHFKNPSQVHAYLKKSGYRVGLRTIYLHVKRGKLTAGKDGCFSRSSVDRYARTFLSPPGGSNISDPQADKIRADTRRSEAMASLAEQRAKRESGKYIHVDEFGRQMAARAMLLKSDLENLARAKAAELCACVNGEHALVPDLVALLLRRHEELLGRYAAPGREWKVPGQISVKMNEK